MKSKKPNVLTGSRLTLHNMRYYVINGILFTIVTSLFKPYAQKFLYRLHGNETHVSLYNALPGLVAVFAIIPGIILISRGSSKKKIIAGSFLMSRLFILTLVIVPFLPAEYQPMTFVILSSLMNFPDSVSNTALQSFTGDIFDGHNCAAAISEKNKYSNITSSIVLIVLALVMTFFGKNNKEIIGIYQIFFIIAFLLSIFEILSFYKLKEVNISKPVSINLRESIPVIFRNKRFMAYMICSIIFYFGWQMGWPLFNIYQIDRLGADEMWLTISGVTSGVVMFFSFNYWKKLILHKGNSYAITAATMGMAVTPLLFALSPNLYVLTAVGLITGFFTAGTVVVTLSSLLEVAPEKHRDMCVAVFATLTNVTLAISPLVSDMILKHTNIFIALIVCSVFRFAGSFAFFFRNRTSHVLPAKIDAEI